MTSKAAQFIEEEGSRPIRIWTDDVEPEALQQLKNIARLPFIDRHGLAVMPDCHAGKGSTVGTVVGTVKALVPAMAGVDLGCGMVAVRLSLKGDQLPDSLLKIRHQIERDVPTGRGQHDKKYVPPGHGSVTDGIHPLWTAYHRSVAPTFGGEQRVFDKAWFQLGSLGGGNHFIEICLDESNDVWIMLHSGSRGIGNMIGTYFIEKAKKRMEEYFITLPDGDLAYLPEDTDDFRDYVAAVDWAQNYALENRRIMMDTVVAALRRHIPIDFTITEEAINCHHNYIARENHFGRNLWVTRKGAIRARKDDLGIIPGSMGQRSYIVRGKGDLESYCSCSHGAGRAMSRTAAKKKFSLQDLVAQTEGVECRKEAEFIDEIPGSYKDIDVVMSHQKDLVEVVHTLKQVLCVKGAG